MKPLHSFSALTLKAVTTILTVTLAFFLFHQPVFAATYFVDSSAGNDSNSCSAAQSTSTPKKTVNSIISCNPGAGDIVKFRGTFTQTIVPPQNGQVLYPFQAITSVSGSTVTFNQSISGLNPDTDYVTVYNSRKGNSGAFAVVSVSGSTVTVDASSLPQGQFYSESASDPGDLSAAILRPVHFTAWDKANPPTFNVDGANTYWGRNIHTIMVSYLNSVSGYPNTDTVVWPAFEIHGSDGASCDYHIFDHLTVQNADSALAMEMDDYHSNYNIIQYNHFYNTGRAGYTSNEVIYYGNYDRPDRHHDYVQIMYNKIGPHRAGSIADGIELKPSAHNGTIFGNEIVGILPNGCDDAPIKTTGINSFISNNYVHDINPESPNQGCGISVIDDFPNDPEGGASGSIIANNIIANVRRVGIRIMDASNVKVLNNTIYNIFPEPDCTDSCLIDSMGIMVQNWQGSTENVEIKNNIVYQAPYGIGRYQYSNNYPSSITSDYNIVYNTSLEAFSGVTQGAHDQVVNPGLVNPSSSDFSITTSSAAYNSGADLSSIFSLDNHDAADPSWLSGITAPTIRATPWDIGAYEYSDSAPASNPPASTDPSTPPTTPNTCALADINQDGTVDLTDYSILAADFFKTSPTNPRSDINSDGIVDLSDYSLLATDFLNTCN